MNEKTVLFEAAPIPKAVFSFALPMMLGMFVTVVYIFVDTFFVAQTGNPNQVAALTVCTPVFMVCMAFGNIFGVGGASVISRLLGEKNFEQAKKTSAFAFYASLALGLVSAAAALILMPQILRLIGTSPDTENFARSYLTWIVAGAPAIILSFALGQIIRSVGAAREALIGMAVGTILNIVLDPIMIITLKLGVEGAAGATVISNLVSVAYYIWLIMHKDFPLSLRLRDFSFEGRIVRGVVSIGAPSTLSELLMSTATIILNNFAAARGDKYIAAIGIAVVVVMVPNMLVMGLSQGVQPLIGYTFAAGLHQRLKGALKFTLLVAIGLSLILTMIILVFGSGAVALFMDDTTVTELGGRMVKLLAWSMPALSVMFVLSMLFQSLGKARQSLVLSVARQGIVYIPILIIFNYLGGQDGIILAQPVADVLSTLIAVALFLPIRKALHAQDEDMERKPRCF